jgi:hypothetical protein
MTQILQTAYDLASEIGYDFFGEIAQKAFEELELSYASKQILYRNSQVRPWQNLQFYWLKSYLKSKITQVFSEATPQASWMRATATTSETFFGSINDAGTKLYEPLFLEKDFCVISELLTFLGSGGELKMKVPLLCEIMEGSETHRSLIKFVNASPKLIAAYKGRSDISFDGKELIFKPSTCFIACTRPLDNKTFTYLDKSGFFSRLHTLQFRISEKQAEDLFKADIKDVDKAKLGQLQKMNSGFQVKLVDKPSDAVLKPIFEKALDTAKEMSCKFDNLCLGDVLNLRIKGDIMREFSAYQYLEPQKSDREIAEWIMKRLPHFFEFAVNPIIAQEFTFRKERTLDVCIELIRLKWKGQNLKWIEILDAMQGEGFSTITINRALKSFRKASVYGRYEIE